MENFDAIQKCWQEERATQDTGTITKQSFDLLLRSRVRKENKIIVEYFWASLVYQIAIYAMASHLLVRYHANTLVVALATTGVLIYVPFTIALLRRFKAMMTKIRPGMSAVSLTAGLLAFHDELASFFQFKKRFEIVVIPLSCLIMVVVCFQVYGSGLVQDHIIWIVSVYILALLAFGRAIVLENRKRFILPLQNIAGIIDELKRSY